MRRRQNSSGTGRAQRGAVALVFGLTLVVLIGFAGLAIDLGRFFVNKSELQNAMDACALAAATQLRPGLDNPLALTQAVAHGQVFATGGPAGIEAIRNRINFQSQTLDPALLRITFSEALDGTYLDSSAANYNTAKYARCSYDLSGLPVLFMRLLNPAVTTATVGALATATLAPSSSTCAIPVGVCSGTGTGGTHENNYNLSIGQWLISKSSAPYGTGNFGWIDFSPPAGGASELGPLLTGSGQCELAIGSPVGQSGTIASLAQAWNSRFGWYRQTGGSPTIDTARPDKTGYAYAADSNWPESTNAYNGTSSVAGAVNFITAQEQNRPYQGNTPPGLPSQNYVPATTEQLAEKGSQYRRLAVAPMVDCSVWDSGPATTTVLDWACVLMLHPIGVGQWNLARLEFRGLSTEPGNPCVTGGEPGSFGPLVPTLVQ